jgi:hypothetical protein
VTTPDQPPRTPVENLGEALALVGAILAIEIAKPRSRIDCGVAARPCPFVSCKANMLIDVTEEGEIILNSGQVDAERGEGANREIGEDVPPEDFYQRVDAMLTWWDESYQRARRMRTRPPDSCLEDIIDRHRLKLRTLPDDEIQTDGMHLETIGGHMFITRERARQLEAAAWTLLKAIAPRLRRRLIEAQVQRRKPVTEG